MAANNEPPTYTQATDGPAYAWIVLLTRPSYLPGVIVLAHSLNKVSSRYPLVAAVTPSLPEYAVDALRDVGVTVKRVQPLKPKTKVSVVADRFEDTWTKLVPFGFDEYEKAVLLDGDMMVMRNMDELFELELPRDCIAANHACVCNLARDAWAPDDWREENCGYTGLTHPAALTCPTPVLPTSMRTHTLLNSGLVVYRPSRAVFAEMRAFLHASPLVPTFSFPDQDFLAHFFRGRWVPLGWQYNAIKTARYWHPAMWVDAEVRNLHYIVDKPWNTGRAEGGEDAVTHGWWWDEFGLWEREMRTQGKVRTVASVRKHMAPGS